MARGNSSFNWYRTLKKPQWAPPGWLFGPVWTVLYVIIGITFGFVFVKAAGGDLPAGTAVLFGLNLVFNLAFTPLQFGLKNNFLAAIDITLVLITLAWSLAAIWPEASWVAYANVPYLLWVMFATVLQFSVTYLNRARKH
jgi:translocator protein